MGVELADVDRGQVGGHRLGRVPDPGALGAVALAAQQAAVGDDLEAGRGGDHEGVGRLVDRVVVDREPAGRDLGLAGDDGAVVGVDEPGLDGEAGAEDELLGDRHAVVADHGGEPVALAAARAGVTVSSCVGPRPAGRAAVHLDRADGQPDEVEVEPGQVLGRPGRDRGHPDEPVGGRVVGHLEQVVADVVAAVAVEREVGVAHPWGARPEAATAASGRPGRRPGRSQRRPQERHRHQHRRGDGRARTTDAHVPPPLPVHRQPECTLCTVPGEGLLAFLIKSDGRPGAGPGRWPRWPAARRPRRRRTRPGGVVRSSSSPPRR